MHIAARVTGLGFATICLVGGCKLLTREKPSPMQVETTSTVADTAQTMATAPPTASESAVPIDSAVALLASAASAASTTAPSRPISSAERQEAIREAAEYGMLGLLGMEDAGAPTAPWGREQSLGMSSTNGPRQRQTIQLRMGALSVNGRLPPEVIQRIVRQNFGRFRLCYQDGLRSNPSLQGRVATKFVIDKDGSVKTTQDGGSDMPDQNVVQCVIRGFSNLSFPQPEGGIVVVTAPIVFSPSP